MALNISCFKFFTTFLVTLVIVVLTIHVHSRKLEIQYEYENKWLPSFEMTSDLR